MREREKERNLIFIEDERIVISYVIKGSSSIFIVFKEMHEKEN